MALSASLLSGGSTAKHEIQEIVGVVSAACRRGTRALEVYAREVLRKNGGLFTDEAVNWSTLIDQCFKMTAANARPTKIQPGWSEMLAVWTDSGGGQKDADLQHLSQALTFESQAYITTAMKNYNGIALRAHTLRSIRFLYPGHQRHVYKNAFNGGDDPAFVALHPGAQELVRRCMEIEVLPCKRATVKDGDQNRASMYPRPDEAGGVKSV